MEEYTDEELQSMAEKGGSAGSADPDVKAYARLFDALGHQADYKPMGLEDAIIARIERRRRRSALADHLWLVAGLVFLVLIAGVVVAISGISIPMTDWQRTLMGLCACAGLLIALFNSIERKLLHR